LADFSGHLDASPTTIAWARHSCGLHGIDDMHKDEEPDWGRIVDEHGARVLRIAVRILGSVHEAEDVAQDVFVEAYRLCRAGPVRNWTGLLVRLATVRALDRRSRTRTIASLADTEHPTIFGPFDVAVANELAERLRAAVEQLPEQQAVVFTLTYFEDLSRDEVASSLGISAVAVSTALYKARRRLMSQLSAAIQGEPR
jgi:RNA polymerase sigma-70 factor (ECF subfamily)